MLTFPRAMLPRVQALDFEIDRYMASNLLRGGRTQVLELAEPRWSGNFTYLRLDRGAHQAAEAWLDSLRGGLRTFLGYDTRKPYPISYPTGFGGLARAGGGVFDGTGDVTAVAAHSMDVATLPPGFVLRAGDMVGLVEGAKRGLYRIAEDVTASAAGALTITFEPHMIAGQFTAAAVAQFERPSCLMILDPESVSAPRDPDSPIASIAFSGLQVLA